LKNTQQAAIQATGLAPPNDLEAAILAPVAAGNYTAILSGNGGGTGIGLVEVYRLPWCGRFLYVGGEKVKAGYASHRLPVSLMFKST
jgi:hypothetical protein